jgi:beta-lactamase superfamily II metal-dependent hydrolase
VTRPAQVPVAKLQADDFAASIEPDDLVHFVLNVGDADCQLLLLPASADGTRQGIVVDVGRSGKLPPLIDVLRDRGFLGDLRIVVATHPHLDHIGGMAELLRTHGDRVAEFWDSGYRQPTSVYFNVLTELEERRGSISYVQPTSGMTRYFDRVRLTVLAPAITLRNRYDSYGVDPNNASVCLKVEYPVTRAVEEDDQRFLETRERDETSATRIVLGADAQMLSWGNVMNDFPELNPDESPVLRALGMAKGSSPLRAEILKVPHHCSKNGLTVELAAMVQARLALVSSLGTGSTYGFPHALAQGALREAKLPIAQKGVDTWPDPDHELGIHYTGAVDTGEHELGSIGLVIKPTGQRVHLWRFMDGVNDPVALEDARRYLP